MGSAVHRIRWNGKRVGLFDPVDLLLFVIIAGINPPSSFYIFLLYVLVGLFMSMEVFRVLSIINVEF